MWFGKGRREKARSRDLARRLLHRHGYPVKLRGEVLTFVLEYCQNHASVASCEVQRQVSERFNLSVSVSQLNRVRAAHGLSRKETLREKKATNRYHSYLWIS